MAIRRRIEAGFACSVLIALSVVVILAIIIEDLYRKALIPKNMSVVITARVLLELAPACLALLVLLTKSALERRLHNLLSGKTGQWLLILLVTILLLGFAAGIIGPVIVSFL